ncbi:hypothetical protein F5X99DRAFT_87631 [Biscogniauxia marginata]|nr:hypothetical protein F5X99DRAFT_87631 [Biscogniauxia marginata]
MGPVPRSRWRWPRSGWRLAAAVNTILASVCAILLLALLAWSVRRSGGDIKSNLVFFAGSCDTSGTINLWLHLLLNVFSTIILASSNFFCQVLNSPSRGEVDASHAKGKSMLIGAPSFSNIFRVGKFKGYAWVLFFLSSIPLHLFFNSAIFQTEYQGGHWNLTLASEAFVNGAPYFNPGAVLIPGGVIEYPCKNCGGTLFGEYGDSLQLEDYFDPESPVSKEIATTSAVARTWKRIEVPECRSQYEFCSARTDYGNVVMVVESQDPKFMYNETDLGWTRDSVLRPLDNLNTNYWDPRVPAAESNSLWFFANCNTTADLSPRTHQAEGCFQTCNRAYGRPERGSQILPADQIEATYSFDFITGSPGNISRENTYWPGLKDRSASKLELKYCLVQEIDPICKVVLSNELLLAVLICVCVKTALCAMVTVVLGREDPFVVPGDAIVSFMTRPDARTVGRCTLDRYYRDKKDGSDKKEFQTVAEAKQWHQESRRWSRAIPAIVWLRSYLLFAGVIIFLGIVFRAAQEHNPYNDGKQTLVHSASNGILDTNGSGSDDLLRSVLTANLPQLLLSFSYYLYNSLYTRLCVEKEWNAHSTDYRPLCVTDPKGEQVSSYRLQLPYRYSIPLISISALLHFLVSNTLYVFILEGGYYMINAPSSYSTQGSVPPSVPGSGLSDDAYIGIGYSTIAILVVLIIAVVLSLIPFVLCWFKIQGPMVLGGCDSIVISAACHIAPIPEEALGTTASAKPTTPPSSLWKAKKKQRAGYQQVAPRDPAQAEGSTTPPCSTDQSAHEMERFLEADTSYDLYRTESSEQKALVSNELEVDELEIDGYVVVDISRGLVRWGAVKAPAPDYIPTGDPVGHLGFGCKEHDVESPIEGHWYM